MANNTFGNMLRSARNKHGYTVRRAADSLGISFAHLSDMENGRELNPTARVLISLCTLYSLKPAKVLNCIANDRDEEP